MVKRISPGFAQQVESLKSNLEADQADFLDAIQSFNEAVAAEWENLQAVYQSYQESLVETATAAAAIGQEIVDEAEEQEAGSSEHKTLTNWAADWELVAEDLQLAAETELDEFLDWEPLDADDALDAVDILDSAPLKPDAV